MSSYDFLMIHWFGAKMKTNSALIGETTIRLNPLCSQSPIPCIKVKKLKFDVPTTAQRVNRFHKRSFLVKIECICLKGLLTYYVSQIRGFSHTPRQQWSGIPSGLPTSGLPTGRQSWGGQFWIHHSSGLPTLILYWFFSFSWMKQCFEGSKASTRSISQVLHQSNSCTGTIRQSQGGSYVKSLKLSQQMVGRVLHEPEYKLMIFDTKNPKNIWPLKVFLMSNENCLQTVWRLFLR